MTAQDMKSQWQLMAKENPFFGITSWPEFEDLSEIDFKYFCKIGEIHAKNIMGKVPLKRTEQLKMVEIGCGLGRMTHYFSRQFKQVVALDISGVMIDRAKTYWRHLDNVVFAESSGEALEPIGDAEIDFVFSFYVLNHVTSPLTVIQYVREAGRVLRAGGIAFLHLRVCNLDAWSLVMLKSRLRRLGHPRDKQLWWNLGITRNDVMYKTNIGNHFSEFAAWHGCEVPWPMLIDALNNARLKPVWIDIAELATTKFAFLVLRKTA